MWVPINSSPAFCYHQLSGTPLPHSLPGDISSTSLAIRSNCNKCLSVSHQSISINHYHPEQASILLNNWGPPGGHGLALNHSSWSPSATYLLKKKKTLQKKCQNILVGDLTDGHSLHTNKNTRMHFPLKQEGCSQVCLAWDWLEQKPNAGVFILAAGKVSRLLVMFQPPA